MKMPTTIIGSLFILLNVMGCAEAQQQGNSSENQAIFAKGELGPEENFTGNAWHTPLVENDSVFTTAAGNVVFEAGARSNWHSHPAGQILFVTAGTGYHQIKGKPIQTIREGDVIKVPEDAKHWHGASHEHSMTHTAIGPNIDKGGAEWSEPVSDEEYNSIN